MEEAPPDTPEAPEVCANRGRSVSPAQYTAQGCGSRPLSAGRPSASSYANRTAGPLHSWREAGQASPPTPRLGTSTELRFNVALSEFQRHFDAERRSMQRQIEHLERRLQEQAAPAALGRERWADLQGSVGGLLEEVTALGRRVENVDERSRVRTSHCEDFVRQKTRELEQQLQAQQQKALMETSTSEEFAKRHAQRLRRMSTSIEDITRRLNTVEEVARVPILGSATGETSRLEARICELEGQQAALEEELRNLAASAAEAAQTAAATTLFPAESGQSADDHLDVSEARALERELAALAQRSSAQLDEHSAALASLRVRTDGQEQRLASACERIDTAAAAPLEALRAEFAQSREHDRRDVDSRLEYMTRRLQGLSESNDELGTKLKERLRQVSADPQTRAEETPLVRRLAEASAAHEQAIRRIEALLAEARPGANALSEEALIRVEGLEQRMDSLEHTEGDEKLGEKADRSELLRLDAALQEVSEPLRRLAQKTASGEAKAAGFERRMEQLQQQVQDVRAALDGSAGGDAAVGRAALTQSALGGAAEDALAATGSRVDVVTKELGTLTARVADLEGLLYSSRSKEDGEGAQGIGWLTSGGSQLGAGDASATKKLQKEVQDLWAAQEDLNRQVLSSGDARERVAAAKQATENLQQEFDRLRSEIQELQESAAQRQRQEPSEGAAVEDSPVVKELQQKLETLKGSQEDLGGKIDAGFARHAEATQSLRQQLDELSSGQKELRNGNVPDELTEKLRGSPDEVEVIKGNINEIRENTQALQQDLQELRGEHKELQHEHKDLVRSAERQHASQGQAVSEVRLIAAEVQAKLAVLEQQHADDKRISDVEAQCASLEKQVEGIKDAAGEVVGKADPAAIGGEAFERQLKQMREDMDDRLTSRIAKVEETLAAVRAQAEAEPERGLAPEDVEEQVRALREQVTQELSRLEEHERELARYSGEAGDDEAALEAAVQRLSQQVSTELYDLRGHQQELQKVRTLAMDLIGRSSEARQRDSNGASATGDSDKPDAAAKNGGVDVEVRVVELGRRMAANDEERLWLRAALQDLGEQVKDVLNLMANCQRATLDLRSRCSALECVKDAGGSGSAEVQAAPDTNEGVSADAGQSGPSSGDAIETKAVEATARQDSEIKDRAEASLESLDESIGQSSFSTSR